MDFQALNMPDLGGTVESVKNAVSSQGMNARGLAESRNYTPRLPC